MGRFATRLSTSVFLAAAIGFAQPMSAQLRAPSTIPVRPIQQQMQLMNSRVASVAKPAEDQIATTVATSPILLTPRSSKSDYSTQATGVGVKVGSSYYDFQTNHAMPNRLTYIEDGSDKYLQILWMVAKDSTRDPATRVPGFNSSRGSHYNYLDATDPDNLGVGIEDWQKIENDRAGWPSIVQFDDGSIGTPSHTPIRFYRNGGIAVESFDQFEVTSDDLSFWPRAAIDGENNIHLIYNRNTGTTNSPVNQVVYRRSTDGGASWGSEIFFSGPDAISWPDGWNGSNSFSSGGDAYSITARGSNVVVVWHDLVRSWFRKSTDYGATWTDPNGVGIIYTPQYTFVDSVTYNNGFGDSIDVYSDTVMAVSPMSDVILDSEGRAHYLIGQYAGFIIQRGLADPTQPRTNFINYVADDALYQYTGLYYYREGDSLIYTIGLAGGGNWDGVGTILSRRAFQGASRYPQLGIDQQDNIYVAYTSVKSGDVLTMQADTSGRYATDEPDTLFDVDALYGHIYLTHKLNVSPQWSAPLDMTPDGTNSLFATLCDNVANNRLYIAYSASDIPGDRVSNVETNISLADIYVNAFDASNLNPISSVNETEGPVGIEVSVSPNPSDEFVRVGITSVTGGSITVSVVSTDGRRIAQSSSPNASNGSWDLVIPTLDLASGAYLLVVEQNGHVITNRLTVVH